ncbi:MAG TPA: hypothetical protein PLO69_05085 [Gammaproteobacteria bacterium]|nr:hypothetical protein [Gammaproteobacteria bacterium]
MRVHLSDGRAQSDRRALRAELTCLRYLVLEHLAPDRLPRRILVHHGAIRKLALGRSALHEFRWPAYFLFTRYADIPVSVCHDPWDVSVDAPTKEIPEDCALYRQLAPSPLPKTRISRHALTRAIERLGCHSSHGAWERLAKIMSTEDLAEMEPSGLERFRKLRKHGSDARFFRHKNIVLTFTVEPAGSTLVSVARVCNLQQIWTTTPQPTQNLGD